VAAVQSAAGGSPVAAELTGVPVSVWGCSCVNASIVGAALLWQLFQGTTWFTERITAAKYPAYQAVYCRRVGRLLPALTGSHWQDERDGPDAEQAAAKRDL
jgi:hypothetical protein